MKVLVPFGPALLALDEDAYLAALEAGRAFQGQPTVRTLEVEPIVDAEACGKALSVSARWLEESARAGLVPCYRFGKQVRFRVSEVAAAHRDAPIPARATDKPAFGTSRRQSIQ
jgi:hypothetical protein